ncbi:MAG: flagellar biosynthesis anti-sigma factor FlgM [Deltaproteobacteria bacterium]|nr:flagellar biosynthesis anti-sigma factor FlgM [Deltaproteobacteria bacterium]MBW1928513.1 flagellar biosynthesis anti-sigma factor FlgM [Deltaproteobacteria bacterium]MBW2024259.1 flagellar biosynthesis anti-sigma factor FlgM [Deltaproteobacteria bacterium]MBW2124615.1 flagellar biosynthesis anti-sigma factor FlgM [Deltaproteobacteria bacterium]RLB19835.1 MAG: flagellar biosynthesis anti-sigma factor FlgM [Deltaproteobacteria bacterium]
MKIDDIYRHLSVVQGSAESTNAKNADSEKGVPQNMKVNVGQDAQVELSDISKAFNSIKEVINREDPERVAKVQTIKEALTQGRYQVDTKSVAEKILKDSLSSLVED